MQREKVDMYLAMNNKFFPQEKMMLVKEQLEKLDDSKSSVLQTIQYKDPTTLFIVSFFLGNLGIDRFMLGETGMGIGKLLTCGGMGVWAIIDWFLIMGATREKNFNTFMQMSMM